MICKENLGRNRLTPMERRMLEPPRIVTKAFCSVPDAGTSFIRYGSIPPVRHVSIGSARRAWNSETSSMTDLNNSLRLTVSLKTLAQMLDAHRSSVRRWLQEAGIRPIVLGRGRNGAIRYRWHEIEAWLNSREQAS